jgi:hypothetical protein
MDVRAQRGEFAIAQYHLGDAWQNGGTTEVFYTNLGLGRGILEGRAALNPPQLAVISTARTYRRPCRQ